MRTIVFLILSSVLFSNPGIKVDIPKSNLVSLDIQDKSIQAQQTNLSEELQRKLIETRLLDQSV